MRPHERQHPNILEYRDSPPPEESDHGEPAGDHTAGMDNEEEAEDAALEEGHDSEEHGNEMIAYEHSDPEAATTRSVREPPTPPPNYNANTAPASTTITAWAPGRRSSRVNEIINRMEAEGRAMMTEEEVQALNAEFEAAPLEENTSLSYEALFEEGTEDAEEEDVADEAEATASTVPPPARPTTPQPKPKGNQFRKWSPQLFLLPEWSSLLLGITCCGCWVLFRAPDCACTSCDCKGGSETHEPRIHFCSSQVVDSWLWQQRDFLQNSKGMHWSWPAVLRQFMFTGFRVLLENMSSRPVQLCNIGLRIFYSGIVLLVLVRYSTTSFDTSAAGTLQILQNARKYQAPFLYAVRPVARLVCGRTSRPSGSYCTKCHNKAHRFNICQDPEIPLQAGPVPSPVVPAGMQDVRTCYISSSLSCAFSHAKLLVQT